MFLIFISSALRISQMINSRQSGDNEEDYYDMPVLTAD